MICDRIIAARVDGKVEDGGETCCDVWLGDEVGEANLEMLRFFRGTAQAGDKVRETRLRRFEHVQRMESEDSG